MRASRFLTTLAALLPLACSNGGASDGGSGVCGGSELTCLTFTDCCTGFQCEGGKCVFVGGNGGNGNGGSSSTSRQGSSASSGFGSSSGTQASGSSSGTTTFGSTGGTTHSSTGGTTVKSSTGGTTHSSTGGTTVKSSSGSTAGGSSSGGSSPDLCALCDSFNCAGANDLCVCDPDDANCTDYYCAGNCMNSNTGAGDQALCPTATTCVAATDSQGSNTDYVCLPSPGTCLGGSSSGGSTSGGSSSGGSSSSGSVSGLCGVCAIYPSTTTPAPCTGQTSLCTCDPADQSCTDGYCVANCENGSAADQALCPSGTTCLQTLDWTTASITEYGCYPTSTGTCLDGG